MIEKQKVIALEAQKLVKDYSSDRAAISKTQKLSNIRLEPRAAAQSRGNKFLNKPDEGLRDLVVLDLDEVIWPMRHFRRSHATVEGLTRLNGGDELYLRDVAGVCHGTDKQVSDQNESFVMSKDMALLHNVPEGLDDDARVLRSARDAHGTWKNSRVNEIKPHVAALREVMGDIRTYARLRLVTSESEQVIRTLISGSGILAGAFDDDAAREAFLRECVVYDKKRTQPDGATRQFDANLAARTL